MNEIIQMLTEIGLPYAYHHFAEGESPNPPFIAYFTQKSENFFADGIVYEPIAVICIELYTNKKDIVHEAAVEAVLNAHGFAWNKGEYYIAEERLYEVVYKFQKEM